MSKEQSSGTDRDSSNITNPSDRLPSLKPKRDLTLGGVKKRVFTPTVPVRRKKKIPDDEAKKKDLTDSGSQSTSGTSTGRGGRQKQDKGARRKKEVITASSVFSMGPAERMMQSRQEMVTIGRVSSSTVQSDREGKGDNTMREKDESKLSSSLKDEPMEIQPSVIEDTFLDSIVPPIKLPLNYTLHKLPSLPNQPLLPGAATVKVKKESSLEEMEIEPVKPVVINNTSNNNRGNQLCVSELFEPSEDGRGMFLLFQFPDCLPMHTKPTQTTSPETTINKINEEIPNSSLRDVPEGVVGKIRVHKSGNVKLVLGDNVLDVVMGTRGGFLQELSSIRVTEPPSITMLGHLSQRLVCVPDLLTMTKDDR